MMPRRAALVAGAAVVGIVVLLIVYNLQLTWRGWDTLGPLRTGRPAPDFSLPTLAGPPLRLSGQRGHLVLLDFWAAWCGPCMRAMPWLASLQRELGGRGLQIISINVEGKRDKAREVAGILGSGIPILLDDGQVSQRYGVHVLPYIVLVGRDGQILQVIAGPAREEKLREQLERALGAPRKGSADRGQPPSMGRATRS